MKKMLAALLVAGIVAVPVGAYATDTFGRDAAPVTSAAEEKFGLADNVYGSFATMKKAWPSATMEDYKAFNTKLEGAKAQLGDAEYAKFEALVKQFTQFGINYPDGNGGIDTSKMTAEDLAAYNATVEALGPYFDKLNG